MTIQQPPTALELQERATFLRGQIASGCYSVDHRRKLEVYLWALTLAANLASDQPLGLRQPEAQSTDPGSLQLGHYYWVLIEPDDNTSAIDALEMPARFTGITGNVNDLMQMTTWDFIGQPSFLELWRVKWIGPEIAFHG